MTIKEAIEQLTNYIEQPGTDYLFYNILGVLVVVVLLLGVAWYTADKHNERNEITWKEVFYVSP